MLFQSRKSQYLFVVLFFLSTLLLSACAADVQAEKNNQPEVILVPEKEEIFWPDIKEDSTPEEETVVISHEEARDIAASYLVEKFNLDTPTEWFSTDQTPEGLLGSSDFLYTSGAWVVSITAPVVAPDYLVYAMEIDHIATGMHWEGKVDAQGNLEEVKVSEPMPVLSPADARDAAVAYIINEYNWEGLGEWTVQPMKPIENAGVRNVFTSGPWVVQVDHYAAAPIVPGYHVVADHMNLVARWEGRISAEGEIVEEAYVVE